VQRIFEHIGVPPIDIASVVANRAMVAKSPSPNFLLNKSGLKELIRRHVPRRLKDEAKKFYYERAQSSLGDAERSRLREVYRDDTDKVAAFIGRDLDHWLREPTVCAWSDNPHAGLKKVIGRSGFPLPASPSMGRSERRVANPRENHESRR
jgi:hypothetical protein